MKFKCLECSVVFEEYEAVKSYERYEFWGNLHYEPIDTCPNCGSDELEWHYEDEYEDEYQEVLL